MGRLSSHQVTLHPSMRVLREHRIMKRCIVSLVERSAVFSRITMLLGTQNVDDFGEK